MFQVPLVPNMLPPSYTRLRKSLCAYNYHKQLLINMMIAHEGFIMILLRLHFHNILIYTCLLHFSTTDMLFRSSASDLALPIQRSRSGASDLELPLPSGASASIYEVKVRVGTAEVHVQNAIVQYQPYMKKIGKQISLIRDRDTSKRQSVRYSTVLASHAICNSNKNR